MIEKFSTNPLNAKTHGSVRCSFCNRIHQIGLGDWTNPVRHNLMCNYCNRNFVLDICREIYVTDSITPIESLVKEELQLVEMAIDWIAKEVERLGWTAEQEQQFLQNRYQVDDRTKLHFPQMTDLIVVLEGLQSEELEPETKPEELEHEQLLAAELEPQPELELRSESEFVLKFPERKNRSAVHHAEKWAQFLTASKIPGLEFANAFQRNGTLTVVRISGDTWKWINFVNWEAEPSEKIIVAAREKASEWEDRDLSVLVTTQSGSE